eukprot:CAMPEP_0202499930 /NCGR_PEP_ID=MMETSP1361-20130828/31430_1 /ASSEMBLY_ACC=CAM_ASM_000849 /TAXON_ID=210615 /ORGANISM="Staurosira complex sp., Strain CCMP2646" /LENGTH=453 /DNA_ID=CAMNT_0049132239 /DNA_START=116 /DNA_END=1477 /DNA_ORIENTATION=+
MMNSASASNNTVVEKQPTKQIPPPQTVVSEQVATTPNEQEAIMLTALARQLEFYFSPTNLSRDTYLQTLQQLNDGHVPISILANFTKIQTICSFSEDRQEAVVKAVSRYSPILQVVHISTVTSKQVDSNDTKESTILAVGPRKDTVPAAVVPPKSPVQNTIILREVQENIKEEDVQTLFQRLKKCPPVQHVRLDVANCWFVTLDTTSRDEIMQVMLDLRSQTLLGEPVKARLKTAATPANSTVNLDITFPAIHNTMPSSPSSSPSRESKKKNKHRRRSKKPKESQKAAPSTPKKKEQQQETTTKAPPKLQEELHFPALETPAVDNIVDKVGCVEKGAGLKQPSADGASTATTASSATSSTSSPTVVAAGAYAAALLKAAPPKTEFRPTKNGSVDSNNYNKKSKESTTDKFNGKSVAKSETVEEPKEEVAAIPMTWGSGRSFAQVLKKEEKSSC